jgi:lysine decarboxylase
LAVCHPGDKIILPRNIHQSAIAGLVLSGAIPIFIHPEYDCDFDLAYSITPDALETTLQRHPDAKAVMIVYPTYQGICGDIIAIAELTHRYNIPLLVDEAHGAHFSFHPHLPSSALSAGADIAIQSTHKVLGAMTQASMLHLQGTRLDPHRISQALQWVQSTSPSYILLASLDAARQQMALFGESLMTQTLELAKKARENIRQIQGLAILDFQQPKPGFFALDTTRLTVKVSELGLSGFEADEILRGQLGVTAELPLLHHLTFMITLGNTTADIEQLIHAFMILASMKHSVRCRMSDVRGWVSDIEQGISLLSPRETVFSPTETVTLEKSVNCISAELICPYPPGIPVLMPGEVITSQSLAYLQQVLRLGARITGCSDTTLQTIKVIRC